MDLIFKKMKKNVIINGKNPSNIQDGADLAKEFHMWKKDLEGLVDSKPMSHSVQLLETLIKSQSSLTKV